MLLAWGVGGFRDVEQAKCVAGPWQPRRVVCCCVHVLLCTSPVVFPWRVGSWDTTEGCWLLCPGLSSWVGVPGGGVLTAAHLCGSCGREEYIRQHMGSKDSLPYMTTEDDGVLLPGLGAGAPTPLGLPVRGCAPCGCAAMYARRCVCTVACPALMLHCWDGNA